MGWAEGLQSGLALGRAFKEGQERRKMEEIQGATANEVQDYTPAGTQQIQGLQASGAYDVQAIPGAEGVAPTLRYVPKQGLDAGDAAAVRPMEIAPQKMTEFLGQRYEGGLTPERMESIRTRAMANAMTDPARRQQALLAVTAEERAQAGEKRAQQGFEAQQEMTGLTIEEARRQKKLRDEDETRQKQLSKEWSDRLSVKDAEGNVTGMRPPTNEDMMWSAQRNAQNLAAAGKVPEAMNAFKDFVTTAKSQIELQGAERTEALRTAAAKVNNGDFSGAKDFYDKYVPDGAKVKEFKENKDGSITVKRVDLHGNAMPDTKTTKEELLKGLVSFNDPTKLLDYAQQSFMNNLHTEQLKVSKGQLGVAQGQLELGQTNAQNAAIRDFRTEERAKRHDTLSGLIHAPKFKNAKGEVVMLDPTKLTTNPDGTYAIPKGLVPYNEKTEISPATVSSAALKLQADTRNNFKMVDGKKVPLTYDEAVNKVREGLKKHGDTLNEDPADRLIRMMTAARTANAVDSEAD
jgi:hypothetical protein